MRSATILTREQLLHTALMMIDADGVDALSMRKLGQALGRDPMRVYRHTKSKAALLDAVAELVLEGLQIPSSTAGDWETAVRDAAHAFRSTALAHPRMVFLLVARPTSRSPTALRASGLFWWEGLLCVLAEAGFDDQSALHACRFFTAFLSGHIIHEVQALMDDDSGVAVDIRFGLNLFPVKQFPRVRALAPTLGGHHGTPEFALALDFVLMGLRAHLLAATANADDTDHAPLTK